MTSARHLVQALEESGFKRIERFETPQPLLSWRNQPLPERAEIIVRRQLIGATADDLGFTRAEGGRFEALVSDILLSRFDRRWFLKLHERYERLVAESSGAPALEVFDLPQPTEAAPTPPKFASTPKPQPPPRGPSAGASRGPEVERKLEPVTQPVPAPPIEPVAELGDDVRDWPRSPVQQAIEQLAREAAAAAAPLAAAGAEDLDLDRELAAVLGAARAEGGKKSCAPFVVGWCIVVVLAATQGSFRIFLIGSVAAFVLFVRGASRRLARMADAGASEFRARVRNNPELRAQVAKKLRESMVKGNGETRQLVEELLKRVSA
jgi:hypothetical protein